MTAPEMGARCGLVAVCVASGCRCVGVQRSVCLFLAACVVVDALGCSVCAQSIELDPAHCVSTTPGASSASAGHTACQSTPLAASHISDAQC